MTDTSDPTAARARRLTTGLTLIAVVVLVADQLSKWAAESWLSTSEPTRWFLGELLGWRLIYNPGAALSIGTSFTWVLTIIAVGVVVTIVRLSRRLVSTGWAVALGLLLGGALGNLGDRFFRDPGFARGHVVDFINYADFFVGNVADIAIVVAAGLIGILSFRGTPLSADPSDLADAASPEDPADSADADTVDADSVDKKAPLATPEEDRA